MPMFIREFRRLFPATPLVLMACLPGIACAADVSAGAGASAPSEASACVARTGELPSRLLQPEGWLKEFLGRQVNGLTGHPAEMGFPFNHGMWADKLRVKERENPQYGSDWWPYEQTAYYLDGALRCAYLTANQTLLESVRKSIDYVVDHPKQDGRLGTPMIDDDSWPMVVFMRALLEEYENTSDAKLLAAIEGHYAAVYPDKAKLPAPKPGEFSQRTTLHVENLCRLARLTGKPEYIDLAVAIYQKYCADYPDDCKTAAAMRGGVIPKDHAVSYHEFLKLPSILHMATGDSSWLAASEKGLGMLASHHELADGLSSAHEGLSGKQSDGVHETCNATDFIWSCGYLLEAGGDAAMADKMEKVLFNAGFGALTKDFKAHQYYSGPNQVILTDKSSHWNLDSEWGTSAVGRMCYRPGHDTECCSGNIHRLVPVFTKRMWLVDSAKKTITAALYSPCTATIPLQGDAPVTIMERTNYPFDQRLEFLVKTPVPQAFTLRLRIPGWSDGYTIACNDQTQPLEKGKDGFVALSREFHDGDRVVLDLKTTPVLHRSANSISVSYGPLVFSLPVKADVRRHTDRIKTSEQFPGYEHQPTSAWNYALSDSLTARDIEVVHRPDSAYPWEGGASPIVLRVKARAATNWSIGEKPYTPDIPDHITTADTQETIELVPLGSTLLRITEFPLDKSR